MARNEKQISTLNTKWPVSEISYTFVLFNKKQEMGMRMKIKPNHHRRRRRHFHCRHGNQCNAIQPTNSLFIVYTF